MNDVLELYEKPFNPKEPMVCVDEKMVHLVAHVRKPLPVAPGKTACEDYEYKRLGTQNCFMAFEPKADRRHTKVTKRRTKVDFAGFVKGLADGPYRKARRIHLVLDNLNTHFPKAIRDVLPQEEADRLLKRLVFHHTPKHASWLNQAEIEIGVLTRQCLDRRFADGETMSREVAAWENARNAAGAGVVWRFTRKKAAEWLERRQTQVPSFSSPPQAPRKPSPPPSVQSRSWLKGSFQAIREMFGLVRDAVYGVT